MSRCRISIRIATAISVSVPNPWKPLDAFTAAGLYLEDLGAGSTSYSAQKNAACRYYSGGSCKTANGSDITPTVVPVDVPEIAGVLGLSKATA